VPDIVSIFKNTWLLVKQASNFLVNNVSYPHKRQKSIKVYKNKCYLAYLLKIYYTFNFLKYSSTVLFDFVIKNEIEWFLGLSFTKHWFVEHPIYSPVNRLSFNLGILYARNKILNSFQEPWTIQKCHYSVTSRTGDISTVPSTI